MSTTYGYSYAVLRYVHDTTSGEFINVGVALYAREARFLGATCRPTYGRLNKTFPGLNPDHFKSLMRYIQAAFDRLGIDLRDELPLTNATGIEDWTQLVLPQDDSSLQWSPAGSGRTANPAETLDLLFDRMVMRYEERASGERRVEEDVWRSFKRTLEARQLLRYFEPKTISVADDEIDFKYTWKNGVLHCLEPLSFDLSTADGVRDKAHRWLGRIASVSSAGAEPFQMYFLVGRPQNDALGDAYENALSILKRVPVQSKIFEESQADQFGVELAAEVERHESTLGR